MGTYVMLTRLGPEAVRSTDGLEALERKVMERIHNDCPEVEWVGSYAILGPADYVDIFRAPDNEAAEKVAVIIRTFGHARTEIWAATEWDRFKELVRTLKGNGQAVIPTPPGGRPAAGVAGGPGA